MDFWLANLVALAHAFAVFVAAAGTVGVVTGRWQLGPVWDWRQRVYAFVAVATLLSLLLHGKCVMTTWEKQLRERHRAGSAYDGTFLGNYTRLPEAVAENSICCWSPRSRAGSRSGASGRDLRSRDAPAYHSPGATAFGVWHGWLGGAAVARACRRRHA